MSPFERNLFPPLSQRRDGHFVAAVDQRSFQTFGAPSQVFLTLVGIRIELSPLIEQEGNAFVANCRRALALAREF